MFSGSNNNTILNSTAASNSGWGMVLQSSSGNLIRNSTGTSNSYFGMEIGSNSNNNTFANFVGTSNSSIGIYVYSSQNNTIANSTGASNSSYGIEVDSSSNNTILNSTGNSSSNKGIYIFTSSNNTILNSTGTSNSAEGICIQSGTYNNIINSTGFSNRTSGIYVFNSNSYDNNIINSVGISNGTSGTGIYIYSSSNNSITNSTGTSPSSGTGINLFSSSNNTIANSTGASNSNYGIFLGTGSNSNTLINSIGSSNSSDAIFISWSSNNTLINFAGASNYSNGIDLASSPNSIITNSTGTSVSNYGIYLRANSDNTSIVNSNGASNSGSGIYIYSCNNDTIINSTGASQTGSGIGATLSNYTSIINTTVSGNFYGIYMDSSNGSALSNEHFYNNSVDLFVNGAGWFNMSNAIFDNPQGGFQNFTNLSINDTMVSSEQYAIKWSTNSSALPSGYSSFAQKFVDISTSSGTPAIDSAVWSWTPDEVSSGYNESQFKLWKYNSSGWFLLNNTPDTAGHTFQLTSMNPASIYGILQLNDTTPPTVTLNNPANSTLFNVTTVKLNFTATDNVATAFSCSLILDGSTNMSNAAVSNGSLTNWPVTGLAQGAHTWLTNCTDQAGNMGISTTRNFTVDTTPPNVNLISPPNDTLTNSSNMTFNYNTTDNTATTMSCALMLDGSVNMTNPSVANGTEASFDVSGIADGPHNWQVACNDSANNTGVSDTWGFTVDTIPPNVTLISPPNDTILNSSTVAFNFTTTDDRSPTMSCTLLLDGAPRASDASVSGGADTSFGPLGIADGNHTWSVSCNDSANNTGASDIWVFTVNTSTPSTTEPSPGKTTPSLNASFSSSCSGNTVTIQSEGNPISDADVSVDGIRVNTTGQNGTVVFGGCGKSVEVYADKSGYLPEDFTAGLISCDACVVTPVTPPTTPTTPTTPVCPCMNDSACKDNEYCQVPQNTTCGDCVQVTGQCGQAKDHVFVPYGYQCGSEPGCPSCPGDEICANHFCISNDLKGPQEAFVGTNASVQAFEGNSSCVDCDLQITDPTGNVLTGKTDAIGYFTIPLTVRGNYTVSLLKNGTVVKTILINALPKAPIQPPVKPTAVTTPDYMWLIWLLILAVLIILLIAYYRSRRKKEPMKKFKKKPAEASEGLPS